MPVYNPALNVAASISWDATSGNHVTTNGVGFLLTNNVWDHARIYRANNMGVWANAFQVGMVPNSGNPFTGFFDGSAMINGGAYRYWVVGFNADESQCGLSPVHFACQIDATVSCPVTLGSSFITPAENSSVGAYYAYAPSLPSLSPPYNTGVTFSNLFETYILANSHMATKITVTGANKVPASPDPGAYNTQCFAGFVLGTTTVAPTSNFFSGLTIPTQSDNGSTTLIQEFALGPSQIPGGPPSYLTAGLIANNGTPLPTTGSITSSTRMQISYQHDTNALGQNPFDSTTNLPGGVMPTTKVRKWLRSWRAHPHANVQSQRYNVLEVDMEPGVTPAGANPQIVLRYTDDAHTWSAEHYAAGGPTGDYGRRIRFRRLGIERRGLSSDRVFELSGTDTQKIVIIGADVS